MGKSHPNRAAAALLAWLMLAVPGVTPAAEEERPADDASATDEASANEAKDPGAAGEGDGSSAAKDSETGETEPHRSSYTERVVVSASATSQTVLDAPAAVDVLRGEQLEVRPADHLADQLRRVPGINVVQFSSRDVNIASREATGGINNSTLSLADGRTLYQDFLGFTMWEFAPRDPALVERVEVVRGPASALWGANAVGGVVHVITKSPRDTLGGRLLVEAGSYDTVRLDVTNSLLVGPWALRVSAGFLESDPFRRPETIVNFFDEQIDPDLGLIDEDFRDSGTKQPRIDLRADWSGSGRGEWILQGGWARTRGWVATGLGPFDVDPSTTLSYAQARYLHGFHEAQIDFNYFDGDAKNLINAIDFGFTSASAHASYRGRELLDRRGVVGWGGEIRFSDYDLSIAPDGDRRTQGAAFGELDLGLVKRLRLITAVRLDYVKETIGTEVSPRAALQYKPRDNHTVRLAWGRAFRSPTVIESNLSVPSIPVAILDWEAIDAEEVGFPFFAPLAEVVCSMVPDNCGVPPGETPDYIAVTAAMGSSGLDAEQTDSLELGYAGVVGRFGIQATVYETHSSDTIDFLLQETYGVGPDGLPGTADDILLPSDPDGDGIAEAPEVDVCPLVNALPPFRTLCLQGPVTYNHFLTIMLAGLVPSLFGYENAVGQENRGFELGFDWTGPNGLLVYVNYSWQDDPEVRGVGMQDIVGNTVLEHETGQDLNGDGEIAGTNDFRNIPARHRVSLGIQVDRPRWFAALSYDHVDETFWQDVLTPDFWGYVPSYDLVGLRGGRRWPLRGIEVNFQITNLLDEEIQQHIYGDIIDRRVSVGLNYGWGPVAVASGKRK